MQKRACDEISCCAFGDTLKELRTERKLSSQYVASKLNVHRTTYSYWEQGRYMPPMAMIFKISEVFEISTQKFLKRVKEHRQEREKEFNENAE